MPYKGRPGAHAHRLFLGPSPVFISSGLAGQPAPRNDVNRHSFTRSKARVHPFDLFGIVDAKAQFRSLAEPWADTGTSTGRLMLAVFGGLADVERDLIRTRTAEGRSRAKERGQPMGCPPSLTPAQQKEATRRRAQGATLQELADSYDRSISTMRRATRGA
jgi:Resolvase, N terminal domain